MADALAKQLQLQRLIERSRDNFKKMRKDTLTPARIRSRITSLKDLWLQFFNGHLEALKAIPEATQKSCAYFKDNVFEETEDIHQATLDLMAEKLEEVEPHVSLNSSVENVPSRADTSAVSLSHLPPITLPPFDGNFDEWEHFRDRFTALIINNKDLRNFAKMHYLSSCVKGRALECIKDIPVTADNFHTAWQALISRYENKRRLLNIHLSAVLNLPTIPRESACDLQTLVDKVNIAVASLKNLQRAPADLWNDILVHIIVQKLDTQTRKAWNIKSSDSHAPPEFDDLTRFLTSRTRALEEFSATSARNPSSKPTPSVKVHSANESACTSSSPPSPCPVCKASHYFSSCPVFTNGTPIQRRELVQKHQRCFNCLSNKHSVRECGSKFSCRLCHQRHHTMLHPPSETVVNTTVTTPSNSTFSCNARDQSVVQSLLTSAKPRKHGPVLLATAWVTVGVASNRTVSVRALLDQGSEMTFVSENVAQLLHAKRVRTPIHVSAIGGVHAGTTTHSIQISVSARDHLEPSFATTALILKNLTTYVPKRVASLSSVSHLKDLRWADPDPAGSDAINIIIGADLYGSILLNGVRKGAIGEPIAQNTIFGWVISGPVCATSATTHLSVICPETSQIPRFITAHHCADSLSLDTELKRFWEIEELPRKTFMTPDEEKCEKHFLTTHSRSIDGRYIVRLPFKRGPPIDIGDSRLRAERLFASLNRRLRTQTEITVEYENFMREYEHLGHMRRVPESDTYDNQCVIIPHHPVVRESSTTTRLRVVFNASSITSNGTSLNDHVHSGPKLQTDLPAILLRWRLFKFVYTADIAKMYRQILVDPRDVNYQRVLWRDQSTNSLSEYQLLTVTYGMACAPYLALRVIRQLVSDEGSHFPLAVPVLHDHIYVDDVLFGSHEIVSLRQTRDQLIALLRRGGFELRKWASNSAVLLQDIDVADHGLACHKTLSIDERIKVLGIEWSPSLDAFQFTVSLVHPTPITKRAILSAIAKLFDPSGWVTPVTITTKVFMQQLWRERLGWDETLPTALLNRWSLIYNKLSHLNGLQLPRWTGLGALDLHAELHGFSDASNLAYAAVIYLRVVDLSGKVSVSLLVGKSRVAPLTPLSVPRLELSAAVLLARLLEFVTSTINADDVPCYCWTDSTIVLAWLAQHPSRWKTFIANRVADIQALVPKVTWGHVDTHENPADCASRGLLGDELKDHKLWWHGPSWLQRAQDEWPRQNPGLPDDAPLEEKLASVQACHSTDDLGLSARYSSWTKLVRISAYLFKFITLCRRTQREIDTGSHPGQSITASEYSHAQSFWLNHIQAEIFPKELHALSSNQRISAKSSVLSLSPFLDRDGIIRVGGRLANSPLSFSKRHPILLASHPLVNLIIDQTHRKMLHAGVQLTLSTLRHQYWIIRSRSLVKAVIHKCVKCARERAALPSQIMGPLPSARVSAPTRSFLHCGVDYAGPVQVRASAGRGITSRKAYISLFVCLATRAVHLELVSDCSTPAFLQAFSRFCSRRGLPTVMYSDNGTTFVGADREIRSAYRAALMDHQFQNQTAADQITWKFIPPSAPHFGGLWEAGVRSVKHHLRRVVGHHTLTFEEFTTLLYNIEACLNSRPLTPLSDTLDNYEVLTPGHFLIGSAITIPAEPSILNLSENRLSRWQLVRQMTERFWKLWSNEYINTLQQRAKWRTEQPSIRVGQLVLLHHPTLPPGKWDLGRVTQCHPGSDGFTRVVTVKTASAELKRPIVKLCPLPVSTEPPSS